MKKDVVCLYDENGLSGRVWAEAGYHVYCYDILHDKPRTEMVGSNKGCITYIDWDARCPTDVQSVIDNHLGETAFVMAFPPCTDLAVSGAAWFAKKEKANPNYRKEAMQLFYTAVEIAETLEAAYFIENPVSVVSTEWRKPDHIFQPFQYGGYLPEDDVHPKYPDYIAPRDAYPKKTCLWTGGGFVMPTKKPVPVQRGYSAQHRKLGGKSAKTKSIRSATPRGIMRAIYEYNKTLP